MTDTMAGHFWPSAGVFTKGMAGIQGRVFAGLLLVYGACFAGLAGAADAPPSVPATNPLAELVTLPYQPRASTQGAIRLVGSTTLQQAAAHWVEGFQRIHPQARCSIETAGSEVGWKALGEGKADMALLSRPVSDTEKAAWSQGHTSRLAVVVAGFERLVWIVHPTNPIRELTWSPETGILSAAVLGGSVTPESLAKTHWDRLNGDTSWSDVPIRVHGRGLTSGTRWHIDRMLTGAVPCQLTMIEHKAGAELAEAVASDRGGLGLVGEGHANRPDVKRLPVLITPQAAALADAVVGSDRSPDCRPLFLAVAIPPEGEMAAELREFLEYVLSYSGQLDVAKDGLLPLSRGEIHAQKELLGWSMAR